MDIVKVPSLLTSVLFQQARVKHAYLLTETIHIHVSVLMGKTHTFADNCYFYAFDLHYSFELFLKMRYEIRIVSPNCKFNFLRLMIF